MGATRQSASIGASKKTHPLWSVRGVALSNLVSLQDHQICTERLGVARRRAWRDLVDATPMAVRPGGHNPPQAKPASYAFVMITGCSVLHASILDRVAEVETQRDTKITRPPTPESRLDGSSHRADEGSPSSITSCKFCHAYFSCYRCKRFLRTHIVVLQPVLLVPWT